MNEIFSGKLTDNLNIDEATLPDEVKEAEKCRRKSAEVGGSDWRK